jgi:hypothetical protein
VSWSRRFDEPIESPYGRKLKTLAVPILKGLMIYATSSAGRFSPLGPLGIISPDWN